MSLHDPSALRRSPGPSIRCLVIGLLLAVAPVPTDCDEAGGFEELAQAILDNTGPERPVRIGLESFGPRNEGTGDPLAAEMRHLLARALESMPGVELVVADRREARSRITDDDPPLGADSRLADYWVRGTVLSGTEGYRLLVDTVQLSTGRIFTEAAWIAGDALLATGDPEIAHRAASLRTGREVDELSRAIGQSFGLELLMGGEGRQSYQVGEPIEYFVRSDLDAHIAVLCHQHDGASYPLLPNPWNDDSFFAAGKITAVHREFEILAGSPGVDVVQAIACQSRAPIDRIVELFDPSLLPTAGRSNDRHRDVGDGERATLFAELRRIFDEQGAGHCASTVVRILVSDPATEAVDSVRVRIRGLDSEARQHVMAALERLDGVQALDDREFAEGEWSFRVVGKVPVSDLEQRIGDHLPSRLVLWESSSGGIEFGPPDEDRNFGKFWFLVALACLALRWTTG